MNLLKALGRESDLAQQAIRMLASDEPTIEFGNWRTMLNKALVAESVGTAEDYGRHRYMAAVAMIVGHHATGTLECIATCDPRAVMNGSKIASIGWQSVGAGILAATEIWGNERGKLMMARIAQILANGDVSARDFSELVFDLMGSDADWQHTPSFLAEALIEVAELPTHGFVNPFTGNGAFVGAMAKAMRERGVSIDEIAQRVTGIEPNPALAVAARTAFLLGVRGKPQEPAVIPVWNADPLSFDQEVGLLAMLGSTLEIVDEHRTAHPVMVHVDDLRPEQAWLMGRDACNKQRRASKYVDPLLPGLPYSQMLPDMMAAQAMHEMTQAQDMIAFAPPRVAFRSLSHDLRQHVQTEGKARGAWTASEHVSTLDVSTILSMRLLSTYATAKATVIALWPSAVATSEAYATLRAGKLGDGNVFGFRHAWNLRGVTPGFRQPTMAIVGQLGRSIPLQEVAVLRGDLSSREPNAQEASKLRNDGVIRAVRPFFRSTYQERFRCGATLYPRVLVFGSIERQVDDRKLSVVSTPSSHAPWSNVQPLRHIVEDAYVRQVIVGSDIQPFRVNPSVIAVCPLSEDGQIMDRSTARTFGSVGLADWLDEAEETWRKFSTSNMSFIEQINYRSNLSVQFPMPAYRVCYPASGMQFMAAVTTGSDIVENTAYWLGAVSLDEAHYVAAILNSRIFTQLMGDLMGITASEMSFHKAPLGVPVPSFNPRDSVHAELARAGSLAAMVATRLGPKAKNKEILKALEEDGIHAVIENACAVIFSEWI